MSQTPARFTDPTIAPACLPSLARLQLVLDGDASATSLDNDSHLHNCQDCRARLRAGQALAQFALHARTAVPEVRLTNRILAAVQADRQIRLRRQRLAITGAIAAVVAGIGIWSPWSAAPPVAIDSPEPPQMVQRSESPPAAEPEQHQPFRIGAELAKAGEALRSPTRSASESPTMPNRLAQLAENLGRPAERLPALGAAPIALSELTDAARIGLEPVTGTAQKAFNRLLRDVGAINVTTKPKS